MKFVPTHKAFNQIEAILIQGFLKNNGIESVIGPDMTDPSVPIGGMCPAGATVEHLIPHIVSVDESKIEEVKELLKKLNSSKLNFLSYRVKKLPLLYKVFGIIIAFVILIPIVIGIFSNLYQKLTTVNWKTYRSEKYGYGLRYPRTWYNEN